MTATVRIALCVSDGPNGLPTGRCASIALHAEAGDTAEVSLQLDAVDMEGPRCVIRPERGYLRLAGVRYPIRSYRQWAGSMAWDMVGMTPETAAKLLNDQRQNGWWAPDNGYEPWWERWSAGEPFTVAMFAEDLTDDEQDD